MTSRKKAPEPLPGYASQPISQVSWVPRGELSANDWNPNRQAPPEFKLLRLSLLENGWTQPIVVRERAGRLEIVDGYHRWLTSEHPDVAAMTGGFVPVVVLPETDDAVARASTVRHNRARGTHGVLPMADVVADLAERGMAPAEIGRQLGMDEEEVDRLLDRGVMVRRGARGEFNSGWTV
jgi:ParB-like chromosome segregation protein Spo0J